MISKPTKWNAESISLCALIRKEDMNGCVSCSKEKTRKKPKISSETKQLEHRLSRVYKQSSNWLTALSMFLNFNKISSFSLQ